MTPLAAPSGTPGPVVFWPVVAAVTAGFAGTGGVVGLGVGFAAYPPTAAVAAVEVGLPAAVVGFLLALPLAASIVLVRRRRGARPLPR